MTGHQPDRTPAIVAPCGQQISQLLTHYICICVAAAGHFVQEETVPKTLLKFKNITSAGFPWLTRWVTLS